MYCATYNFLIDKQSSSALLMPQENKRPESRKHQKKKKYKCNLPPLQPIRRRISARERSRVVDHVMKCCQTPANLQLHLPAMLPKRPTTVRPRSPRAAMRLDVLAEPSDALAISLSHHYTAHEYLNRPNALERHLALARCLVQAQASP